MFPTCCLTVFKIQAFVNDARYVPHSKFNPCTRASVSYQLDKRYHRLIIDIFPVWGHMWNIPHTIGMIMMKDNVTKPTLGCATHSGSTRHRGGDLNAHWPVQWHAVSSRWLEQCYVLPRGKSSPAPEGWRTWLPWKLEPVTWNRLPATLGASSDYTASHLCTTTICIGEKVSDFFLWFTKSSHHKCQKIPIVLASRSLK